MWTRSLLFMAADAALVGEPDCKLKDGKPLSTLLLRTAPLHDNRDMCVKMLLSLLTSDHSTA